MRFSEPESLEDEINMNVIPLVDVMLVLLIFFMATASFTNAGSIDVKLPKAASEAAMGEDKDLIVSIDTDGRIFVDQKTLSLEQLSEMVHAHAGSTLVIRADEHSLHGRVVEVMDLAKRAGIQKLAIATEIKQ